VAHTVVLHVGAMKSGTSFLQGTLGAHRDELAAQGFLFPGRPWRRQVLAVLDVLGKTRVGEPVEGSSGAWDRLVAEIAAHPGTAVVSMEFLGPSPRGDIARVVDSLRPADVRAVMTVRDLGRNIPAMWQEALKNGATWRWTDYVRDLEGARSGSGSSSARRLWRRMDYPVIAGKWADAVGRDRFSLVTVPHPGAERRLLWERFCSVVGLDPAPFDTGGRRNSSLGAASAQVLRAVNESLPEGFPLRRYNRVVKQVLAQGGLEGRPGEPAIGFDAAWVARRAEDQIARLAALDVRVAGDLAELRPVATAGVDPDRLPAEEQLQASLAALAHLVRMWPVP